MSDPHKNIAPPRLALNFLRWFCDRELLEDVEGDLAELYRTRLAQSSKTKANWHYVKDVIQLFRPGIIRHFDFSITIIHTTMLINHIKSALRHALKHKGYSLINLSGLVVGLVSSILILLWVADEIRIDKFHVKADRIYQVWRNMHQGDGSIMTTPGIPQPLAPVLEEEYPEVEDVTLLSWEMEFLFRLDDKTSYEKGRYASPGFFNVFSFPLLAGDPTTMLNDVHSVAISESVAIKFFGENWKEQALGKSLKVDERQEFLVTGVFADPGSNSSFSFDWILPAREYIQRNDWVEDWGNGGFRIYISMQEGADMAGMRSKVKDEIVRHTNDGVNEFIYLQRFADNYLNGTFENGVPVGGRIQYVKVLIAVALFILLVACINFMNLATARASTRAREIGVRKVMGAQRGPLSQQFFIESFLHSMVSVAVALLVVYLLLPFFNDLTSKTLVLDLGSPQVWMVLVSITVVTGLLSGSYPALLLSSFAIIKSLKGVAKLGKDAYFRHGLTAFQFAISIFLISGTIIVSQQMDYILSKDLGLDKENVIMIGMTGELNSKNDIYRNELKALPEVKDVTFTSGNPLNYGQSTGGASWEGKNMDDVVGINVLSVGADFLQTMDMKVVDGKGFENLYSLDSAKVMINEVLARIMGFENPVGQKVSYWGVDATIIGVVKNFHMDSMYEPIAPLIVRYAPGGTRVAFVRTQGKTQEAIAGIEKVTKDLNPAFPFRYEFLDQEYSKTYQGETTVSKLVNIFAGVSIFISCLGLLGLSSFSADQRAKEIGIRKVHGAGSFSLVLLLSKHYARLMLIAFVVATPVSYFYIQSWLSSFAFRITPSMIAFVAAGIVAFMLGALTVSFKSYQAATVNPIKTLRDE